MSSEHIVMALLVPALGGLTFIAYKHPDGYQRIYRWVWGAAMVTMIAGFLFRSGAMFGHTLAIPYMRKDAFEEAAAALDAFLPSSTMVLVLPLILAVYTGLLRALPLILDSKAAGDATIEEEEDR